MLLFKHAGLMVVLVSAMLVGCASSDRGMPYGQYSALKHMCEQQEMKPAPVIAYSNREKRMYTKSLTCYDEYGAAFDFTKQ